MPSTMKLWKPFVYIASPYTRGDVALNVRFQMHIWNTMMNDGMTLPFAPLMSHFQHTAFPRPYQDWIRYDLEILPRFDAVLRLSATGRFSNGQPYQQDESTGADGEVARAVELNIPVFYDLPTLYEWIDKKNMDGSHRPLP